MEQLVDVFRALLDDPTVRLWAQTFALVVARVLPIATFSPIFGGQDTAAQFRVGLSVALGLALTPSTPTTGLPVELDSFAGLLLKELLLGTALAVVLLIVFELFAAAGIVVDSVRGATMAEAFDPTSGQRVSVLGAFFKLFFVTIFVVGGGHRLVVSAFGEGLARLPPGAVGWSTVRELLAPDAASAVLLLAGELLLAAIQLTLPVICVMIVIDVALGLLNRVASQISAFFLGMTIKGTIGVLVVLLVLNIGAEHFFEVVPGIVRRVLSWG